MARLFHVDAFTDTPFTGNPAVVVLDAGCAADTTLAAVAREFAPSEVAYVMAPTGTDHDVRIRFFNARKEAPFVGHATIAAHAVLRAVNGRTLGVCRQSSGTGVIEVRLSPDPDRTIRFRQTVPDLDAPLPLKTTLRVAEALHLPGTHLHESLPARIARRGGARLLVPVANAGALDEIRPNSGTLMSLGAELGTDGFFVFALQHTADGLTTESRMFCPALGIAEDPVSGNAHAMLAAYLWDAEPAGFAARSFVGRQGRAVQRPGVVEVTLEVDHDRLRAVHIGGTAVIVSEGTLAI